MSIRAAVTEAGRLRLSVFPFAAYGSDGDTEGGDGKQPAVTENRGGLLLTGNRPYFLYGLQKRLVHDGASGSLAVVFQFHLALQGDHLDGCSRRFVAFVAELAARAV